MMPPGQSNIIGVLSDSHGNVDATRRAVASLVESGARTLIHLGDVESESVLDELVGHESYIVFGNCDYRVDALTRHARSMGLNVAHPAGRMEVSGQMIAFTHGHLPRLMDEAIDDGVQWLLHGHTHEIRDEQQDRTRIINPGALFRAERYTVALLEPATREVRWIEIPKSIGAQQSRRTGQI